MVAIAAERADGRPTWLGPWRLAMGGDWFIRERMLVVGAYEMVCVPAVARVNDDLVRPLIALPKDLGFCDPPALARFEHYKRAVQRRDSR